MSPPGKGGRRHAPTLELLLDFAEKCKAPKLRTMREFAEQEIIIPNGPHEGHRFKCDRQPYTRLLFDAIEEAPHHGIYKFFFLGPVQSGKTLNTYVVPCLYHLFEMEETVICGIPNMDMAYGKWLEDIEPVIKRTKYAQYLPTKGAGSRGGKFTAITFTNGATLRFMGAGGSDAQRSGFTARVLVMTEVDKYDEQGGSSRETDKASQMIARTKAFKHNARIYGECTVSIDEGRIWSEYTQGTESKIVLPCPKCGGLCVPPANENERKLLTGWQDAETVMDARSRSKFLCSECGEPWTEKQRQQANDKAILIHKGQTIVRKKKGYSIRGKMVKTDTLGFRWSAINNLFVDAEDIGADEWRAARAKDEENAKREILQFNFALPYTPPRLEMAELKVHEIMKRVRAGFPRGLVPDDTMYLTGHVDLHKDYLYYLMVAWRPDAGGHIVDYDVIDVHAKQSALEHALERSLDRYHELAEMGWAKENGGTYQPEQVWIDAGWGESTETAYQFCRKHQCLRYKPAFGRGAGQRFNQRAYVTKKKTNHTVQELGEEYHLSWYADKKVWAVEVNSDYWKSWAQQRLVAPVETQDGLQPPGAMTLFDGPANHHLQLARHFTAEKKIEEYLPGKGGLVVRWERLRRANHWLDNLYNACAAGHYMGVRLIESAEETDPAEVHDSGAGRFNKLNVQSLATGEQ